MHVTLVASGKVKVMSPLREKFSSLGTVLPGFPRVRWFGSESPRLKAYAGGLLDLRPAWTSNESPERLTPEYGSPDVTETENSWKPIVVPSK